MPRRMRIALLGFLSWSLTGVLSAAGGTTECDGRNRVQVILHDSIPRQPGIVRVGDVAALRGGPGELRRRIAALDLLECGDSKKADSLSRGRIRVRLLLGGIAGDCFEIGGAPAVTLAAPSPLVDETILSKAIAGALEEEFGIPEHEWDLRFKSRIPEMPSPQPGNSADLRIDVETPQIVPLGPTSLRVTITQGGQPLRDWTASLNVGVLREVAVARQLVGRGESLNGDRIEKKRVRISEHARYAVPDELTGRTARVALRPGQPIRWNDTEDTARREVLVRPRELVRLVASKGRLQVTLMNAEALDHGRLGENVRVRNPDTGKIVSGRVVGPGAIEVRL